MNRVIVVLLLVLTGCSLDRSDSSEPELEPVPVESSTAAANPPDLQQYYDQELEWRECRRDYECAELTVPLDYARPDGRTIELSVLRVPSTEPDQRIGSLVVNPGGPGGSSLDYAAGGSSYWGEEVRAAFDMIGIDPRGVGESTPIDCATDSELDTLIGTDPDPDNPDEVRADHAEWASFFSGCMQRDPELATHMGTLEAAKDLDILREALGEPKLSYFGASYGTFLGGTYADQFPERVGRLVLDGAIDPSTSSVDMALVQAEGFETALRAYVGNCVESGDCYLGDSVDAGIERIQQFLADLDRDPLPGAGDRELTEGLGLYGMIAPLYNRDYWPILDAALAAGLNGSGRELLSLSDAYTSRGPDGYTDNAFEVLPVVNCSDYSDAPTDAEVEALLPRFEQASPTFGRTFAADLGVCADWAHSSGRLGSSLTAKGSDPIMVVGTSRDPATPLRWAEGLAAQLDNAVLVKRDGDGHTAYHSSNQCIDDTIEKYLVSGVVPEETVSC